MMKRDFGLRYVSPRRWCWRADDGSWRDVQKWSVKLYLTVECGLADKQSKETAMKEAIENFQVDIAGDYRFDKKIYDRVNRFGHNLPIDRDGILRGRGIQAAEWRAYTASAECAARINGIRMHSSCRVET
jgi:hypothetical protein